MYSRYMCSRGNCENFIGVFSRPGTGARFVCLLESLLEVAEPPEALAEPPEPPAADPPDEPPTFVALLALLVLPNPSESGSAL